MEDTLKFTAETILAKKFPKDIKGYDAYEVDAFLDEIIKDYQTIEDYVAKNDTYVSSLQERIRELEERNDKLVKDNVKLSAVNKDQEMKLATLNNRFAGVKETDKPMVENLHIIKRMNLLEQFFHDKGFSKADLERYEEGKE